MTKSTTATQPFSDLFDPSIRQAQITKAAQTIATQFQPEKIFLFGSFAYGQPNAHSDIDLLVVMPFAGSPFRQAAKLLGQVVQAVGVLPLDLLVRTQEQVQERLQLGDRFMQEITERGKVLYEAAHAGMD